MKQTYFLDKIEFLPFIEIVGQYAEKSINCEHAEMPILLSDKLQDNLLEELSYYAEVTLQLELEKFVKLGGSNFDTFCKKIKPSLAKSYPLLHDKLRTKSDNLSNYIFKILNRFQEDKKSIIDTFNLSNINQNLKVVDIESSLGDAHNGEGTALVKLSDGTKLIYKPRNIEVTNSYNAFLDWLNVKLNLDLKTFKILHRENYGWIEFVEHEDICCEEELQEYYYKAGALLSITMLLGSKDYHRENIIASGKNPVLVDHETIIQPCLQNDSLFSWEKVYKIPKFSVLESALIVNSEIGFPKELVGFGIGGYLEITEPDNILINQNTLDSKRLIRFKTRKLVDKNVPIYKGQYVFANQYKELLKKGFSTVYDLFLKSKEELKSDSSPLRQFRNKEVRYVWRPTFVYFKILKYLRNPAFMSSSEAYESKLYELLSKAYKGEHMDEYRFILDFEMKHMLNGDIPIFTLGSTENFLEGNTNFKIFEQNCIENIYHRIELLSEEHKNEQIYYIDNWLNIQF